MEIAKGSLPNVPDEIAVAYLLEAGRVEAMRLVGGSPQAGLGDMAHAFNLALQMSSHDDGPEAMLRRKIKERTEELAVDFTAPLEIDQALALVRRADMPRDRLYDQVLYSQAVIAGHDRKLLRFEFMPIVRECMASGAFPYRGVIQIIQNGAIPEDQRMALARLELQ